MHLREAKNDQFQRGQTRAHHRTSAAICPVDALQAHARQNPVWISDPSAVVFQFQSVGVTREMVSDLLRLAAVAEGHPSHLVGSHSLRKGGATAMLACTDDLEQVKRFGGWKSDAVHAYLYADHATSKTRSSDMLRSKPILSSAQRTGSQPARHRPSGVKCGGHPPTLFGGYPPVASLIVGGHPPCAEAMAEARTAKAVTNHQMKELVRAGKSAYDILGVSRDTTPTDVEKAYRRKCLKPRDAFNTQIPAKSPIDMHFPIRHTFPHSTHISPGPYPGFYGFGRYLELAKNHVCQACMQNAKKQCRAWKSTGFCSHICSSSQVSFYLELALQSQAHSAQRNLSNTKALN